MEALEEYRKALANYAEGDTDWQELVSLGEGCGFDESKVMDHAELLMAWFLSTTHWYHTTGLGSSCGREYAGCNGCSGSPDL